MAQIDLILTPIKLKSSTKRSPRWRLSTTRWLQRKVPFLASERGDFILLSLLKVGSVRYALASVDAWVLEKSEKMCDRMPHSTVSGNDWQKHRQIRVFRIGGRSEGWLRYWNIDGRIT